MRKVALYTRVSTTRQTCENQLADLREIATRNNWLVTAEYVDQGVSGANVHRPALDSLMKAAVQRRFDLVMCWDISRLGRSLPHLVQIMEEMRALRIDMFFFQQSIDTSTPAGKLCFQIFGSLAEWERDMIRERVRAGLDRARTQGKKLGRPSVLTDSLRAAIGLLYRRGASVKQIASQLKVGVGTVYKVLFPRELATSVASPDMPIS